MLKTRFIRSITKAFIICVVEALISGTLNYCLQMLVTDPIAYPFNFKSIFFDSLIFCSIVYGFYLFLFKYITKPNQFSLLIQSISCFLFVIALYILATLASFGFSIESLLIVTVSLGISNALIPLFDKLIYRYLNK
jgi:hypothetical protein